MSGLGESDDDSFSSDSDDEFLTLRGDGNGAVDREALVRKKLLESFYGTTNVGSEEDLGVSSSSSSSGDSSSYNDGMTSTATADGGQHGVRKRSKTPRSHHPPLPVPSGEENDLDSVHFDALKHTERYVLHSSVHPLLEKEESLACQVRTLDSSMQTLVYENYSRFIEATDAVRNIGVNVQCNAGNLEKLSETVVAIGSTSREVETTCGKLRDSVVEKLRTKRLLQRLESLLKLPSTLHENIQGGRYRWATKSYLKAYAILNKQSEGFESLQRIEQECHAIMQELLETVRNKLYHWSGNDRAISFQSDASEDDAETMNETNDETILGTSSVSLEDPPDPPQTVAEIFECAGTQVLIQDHQQQHPEKTVGLSVSECQDMSLDACSRFIERILDAHHIELQEDLLLSNKPDSDPTQVVGDANGNALVPTKVLDSILETSALYSVTFSNSEASEALSNFVQTSFHSFLQHVKAGLFEQSAHIAYPKDLYGPGVRSEHDESENGHSISMIDGQSNPAVNADQNSNEDEEQEDSEDQAHEHIANATALLLESVQQFASGLDLPEVAIEKDIASDLIEQAVAVAEAMVRRRVDQKFFVLRFRVFRNCLVPFCRQALRNLSKDIEASLRTRMDRVVEMASVALSDSSQLVDDTVRSILGASNNNTSIKTAVEQSTARFAVWLATTMEILAGCESGEPKYSLDIEPEFRDDTMASVPVSQTIHAALFYESFDDDANVAENDLQEVIDCCMSELLEEVEAMKHGSHRSGETIQLFTLAIAEMCRLAERNVLDDISQSIATHTGEINKHRSAQATDGLFATKAMRNHESTDTLGVDTQHKTRSNSNDNSSDISQDPATMRFRLAASRILGLYAMDRGHMCGECLSSELLSCSENKEENDDGESIGPRDGATSLLAVVKSTASGCAGLFGCPIRAGPVPESIEDEFESLTISRQKQAFRSTLAIDVERMFAEKVTVYPHPFEMFGFDRNLVIVQVLKIAFKSLLQDIRLVRFSNKGFRRLLVDVEFLKFMLPHYVKDEELVDHSTTSPINLLEGLLTEIIKNAKERCDNSAMLEDDAIEVNQARAVIRDYMASNGGNDGSISKFIISDDEESESQGTNHKI